MYIGYMGLIVIEVSPPTVFFLIFIYFSYSSNQVHSSKCKMWTGIFPGSISLDSAFTKTFPTATKHENNFKVLGNNTEILANSQDFDNFLNGQKIQSYTNGCHLCPWLRCKLRNGSSDKNGGASAGVYFV